MTYNHGAFDRVAHELFERCVDDFRAKLLIWMLDKQFKEQLAQILSESLSSKMDLKNSQLVAKLIKA